MTAVSIHRPRRRAASCMNANEPEDALLENDLLVGGDSDEGERVKIKKKRKKDKRRKRYSSSGESCSSEHHQGKRKRSKRKRRDEDDENEAGGRINPIFLWVKENNAKIVQVMCEDYDKRNRIKLTKTPNGWISVPHIQNEWSRPAVDNQLPEPSLEPVSSEPEETPQYTEDDHHVKQEAKEIKQEEDEHYGCSSTENNSSIQDTDNLTPKVEVQPCEPESMALEISCTPEPESSKDPELSEPPKPCCNDLSSSVNLDENHNNEVNPSAILPNSLAGNQNNDLTDHLLDTCVPDVDVDSFCNDDHDCVVKGIIDELESSINSSEDAYENSPDSIGKPEPVEFSQHSLMEELDEICHDIMNEELKADKPEDKAGVELFAFGVETATPLPLPTSSSPDTVKSLIPVDENPRASPREILGDTKPADEPTHSPKNSPINLVVENKIKPKEDTCLTENDLETLDILWRIPEGTTIHQSKHEIIPAKCKESSPSPVPLKPFDDISIVPRMDPVQEEPLNLGKPKDAKSPKIDIRPEKFFFKKDSTPDPIKATKVRSKSIDLCPEIPAEPLTQLKELMADPDMSVPDPLLVPKARLPALVANPKQEIPRLLALNNEIKYSRLEADLLEVSLAHLQLLVQSGSKVDDMKTSQKNAQMLQSNNTSCMDSATMNALNQMLWLPYLTQLEMPRQNNAQDLIGMMNMMSYPYNWSQKAFDCLPTQPQQPLMPTWEDILHRPPNFLNSSTFPSTPRLYADPPKNPQSNTLPHRNTFAGAAPRIRDSSRMQSTHRRNRPVQPPSSGTYSNSVPDFYRTPQSKSHLIPPSMYPQTVPPQPMTHPSWPVHSQRGPSVVPPVPQPHDMYNRVPPTNPNQSQPIWTTPVDSTSKPSAIAVANNNNKVGESLPKLKVRKFDIDPNSIPKLLNLDRKYISSNSSLPHEPAAAAGQLNHHHPMYNGNHLWHPLYAGPEEKKQNYVSPWNWTTPVTVSGK